MTVQVDAIDIVTKLVQIHANQITAVDIKVAVGNATQKVRDNAFNAVIIKTFSHSMGLINSNQIAGMTPLADGGFWVYSPSRKANVVFPNFEGTWSENKQWVDKVVKYICKKHLMLVRCILQTLLQSGVTKAKERAGVHTKDAALQGPKWDFLFQPAYQSSDESSTEGVVDPGSPSADNDNGSSIKLWLSCPPTYRADEATDAVVRLNRLVFTKQREALKGGAKKIGHPFTTGDWRERGLPGISIERGVPSPL
ncbi:hypothetical protein BV22DRAFT_1133837 [Leucogyrophana mollusca]|uniref:Uncharacterized protein n=1 Tax=Leucogyrophana mollusca TaxID=85980 RepID=A0ACB8B102_9AGAM|nr:hypothetical protein BV22DRAFT_1133837 [Leucogyrophana mollusca]